MTNRERTAKEENKEKVVCCYCGKGMERSITVRGDRFHPRCYQSFLKHGSPGRKGFYARS